MSLTLRQDKGSKLTIEEMDANLEYLEGLATANTAFYLNRANHSGFQPKSTVTGLVTDLNAKIGVEEKGSPNGLCELDGSGTVPISSLPFNGLSYKGSWDANANSPAITSGVGTLGDYYWVSTAGSTTIDGVGSWSAGEAIVYNGSVWQKALISTGVASWNSLTGAVSATTNNLPESANKKYVTDSQEEGLDAANSPSTLNPIATMLDVGSQANTLWVDGTSGNDGTAVKASFKKPYLTLGAAIAAAVSGDTIVVLPATYSINALTGPTPNLYKNGVRWHFMPGAKIVVSGKSNDGLGGGVGVSYSADYDLFDVSENNAVLTVTGYLEFSASSTGGNTGFGQNRLLRVNACHSINLYFEIEDAVSGCGLITIASSATSDAQRNRITIKSNRRISLLNTTGNVGTGSAIQWRTNNGFTDLVINADLIECNGPSNSTGAAIMFRQVNLQGSRVKIKANRVNAYNDVFAILGGAINFFDLSLDSGAATPPAFFDFDIREISVRGAAIRLGDQITNATPKLINGIIIVNGTLTDSIDFSTGTGATTGSGVELGRNFGGRAILNLDFIVNKEFATAKAVVKNQSPSKVRYTGSIYHSAAVTVQTDALFYSNNATGEIYVSGKLVDNGAQIKLATVENGKIYFENFTYETANAKSYPLMDFVANANAKEIILNNCLISWRSLTGNPMLNIPASTTNFKFRTLSTMLSTQNSTVPCGVIAGGLGATGNLLLHNSFLVSTDGSTPAYTLNADNLVNMYAFNTRANVLGTNGSIVQGVTVVPGLIAY